MRITTPQFMSLIRTAHANAVESGHLIEQSRLQALCDSIKNGDEKYRTTARWSTFDADNAPYALIAYLANREGQQIDLPVWFSTEDNPGHDACGYEIFADGSLYFYNNAEDEVWSDYRDFVTDCLIPGIQSQKFCWNESEQQQDEYLLWDMDRKLLVFYAGNELDARGLVNMIM